MLDLRSHFSQFLTAVPNRLHFAAHSHHPWPDATQQAQEQYWRDSARWIDDKWTHIFEHTVPAVQQSIARHLNLPQPATLAFAPNTHNFVNRLLSCCPAGRPIKVLTTDSEFHSLSRQLKRNIEAGLADVTYIPTAPLTTFPQRFAAAAHAKSYDFIYFSHVCFNSGYVVPDLTALVRSLPPQPIIAVDGYHGFMAIPTDLSHIHDRIFYLAGGYKYAMAGEGICFMHCPSAWCPRPVDTGWYASFGALAGAQDGPVGYGPEGMRFWGATFDATPLYRFRAVQDWYTQHGLDVASTHAHVKALQQQFINGLEDIQHPDIRPDKLVPDTLSSPDWGHFLTFVTDAAGDLSAALADAGVMTDYRQDRLRFGFGIYHTTTEVAELLARIASL